MRCVAAASLALVLLLAGHAGAADGDFYTVLPNETCAQIAKKVWPNEAHGLKRLHRLNPQLGPLPHNLKAGTQLRIREIPGEADAHLTYLKPSVQARKGGASDWIAAARGLGLFRLDQVNTLKGASANVTFRDQTALTMDENALIIIYGATEAQAREKSGVVELVEGDLRMGLAAMRGEGTQVATPGATVTLRSKDVAVGVDKDKMSRVSVFDGDADVAARGAKGAKGAQVKVQRGFGTRVAKGKPPEPPQPLPAAPTWSGTGQGDVVLALGDDTVVTLAWNAVPGAASYKLELASDAAMSDRLFVEGVGGKATSVDVPGVLPGHYFARAAATNAAGLLGMPSEVRAVEVVLVRAQGGRLLPGKPGEPPTFSAFGVGQVALPPDAATDVTLDGKPVSPVIIHGIGRHELSFAPRGGGKPALLGFVIEAPHARLALDKRGANTELVVELLGDGDASLASDLDVSDLVVEGRRGTTVAALVRGPDGKLRGRVTPGRDAVAASVKWTGALIGDLTEERPVIVAAPPPPPAPPAPPALVSLASVIGQPAATVELPVVPTAWLAGRALELRGQPQLVSSASSDLDSRASLDADLRVQRRLALAASLALVRSPIGNETKERALSTVSAGARALLLARGRTRLAAALDETIPFGQFHAPPNPVLRSRAMLMLGVTRGKLAVSTAQGAFAAHGKGVFDEVGYQGNLLAGVRVARSFAMLGEVGAVVGRTLLSRRTVAVGVGGGIRYRTGPTEFAFALHGGLGGDATPVWGRLGALVSVGYRIP